ncbi:hypothetical protein [Alteromonas sp. M12]|uniref:hypothetical protein n=1 Tax=Alteromonas sp. M12 TaxID=3135644 RepID=UPI00319EB92F
MAKTINPLTNTEVKQAKPKDKDYTLLDGKGLQHRVRPTGTISSSLSIRTKYKNGHSNCCGLFLCLNLTF